MALRKIERRRAPLDGTWFRTEAKLNSIFSAASNYDDRCEWPKFVNDTVVPIWVRMAEYQGGETRENPTGKMFGPIVRIGSMESPEIELFGHQWSAGLSCDAHLDGWEYRPDRWLYRPLTDEIRAPGHEVSVYACDKCNHHLYLDEMGRRFDRSACLFNGELVCRDCDVTGLVYDAEAEEQIARCRRLADFLGPDHRRGFDRNIERLGQGFCFGMPSQTRLYKEDRFSFGWGVKVFTPEGTKPGMHGGLIQHGPGVHELNDGTFQFRTWDYANRCVRDANEDEAKSIRWSIHT